MEPSTYRGLAFLLSLGTLPLACQPDEGSSESGAGKTTGPGTSTDSTGTGTSTVTDASGPGPDTSTATASAGSSADPTGGPGGLCEQYAALFVMCDPMQSEQGLIAYCEATRERMAAVQGPACAMLFDEFLACLTGKSCDEVLGCEELLTAAYDCKPEIGAVCAAFGAKSVDCMLDVGDAAFYCQYEVNTVTFEYGPACGSAYEDMYACFAALSCADLEAGTGCEAEKMAFEDCL